MLYEFITSYITKSSMDSFSSFYKLTQAELEVIYIIALGVRMKNYSNKNIKTLSTHKRNAYKKIGIVNDAQLIHCIYMRLISNHESH